MATVSSAHPADFRVHRNREAAGRPSRPRG
jgi:hypothetical protein